MEFKEFWDLIEDDYNEQKKEYKKIFNKEYASKEDIVNAFNNSKNIVKKNGKIEGILSYLPLNDHFEIKTIIIDRALRKTYSGDKLILGLYGILLNKAYEDKKDYISVVVSKIDKDPIKTAIKMGYEIVGESEYEFLFKRNLKGGNDG